MSACRPPSRSADSCSSTPRLSSDQARSCATCHDPAKSFADGRDRSQGHERLDRNAIALANLRLNRWYGWSGAADSLWAQSLRPILDAKEFGMTAPMLRDRLAATPRSPRTYRELFSAHLADDAPERMLVNLAKALAAFQETIVTQRTAFDDFRDALERDDAAGMARYPPPAQRGLKIFVGKGRCTVCHFGPNFTNGEFDDVGVPYFAEPGRVDSGRHGGIATLRDNPFNLLGPYNDGADATHTRHVETQHRNWGEFRVPSLRNVARTAPYMHNGSLATLADVVRHYSEVDSERLHGDDGARIIRALRLTPDERADLVASSKPCREVPSQVTVIHSRAYRDRSPGRSVSALTGSRQLMQLHHRLGAARDHAGDGVERRPWSSRAAPAGASCRATCTSGRRRCPR